MLMAMTAARLVMPPTAMGPSTKLRLPALLFQVRAVARTALDDEPVDPIALRHVVCICSAAAHSTPWHLRWSGYKQGCTDSATRPRIID
jgi:hypothetical protein